MKWTPTNLLLLTLVFAVAAGAWIDRSRLKSQLLETEEARVASNILMVEAGLRPLRIGPIHEEEDKLRETLHRNDRGYMDNRTTDRAFEILAVCRSYGEFDDEELPRSFIRRSMNAEGWDAIDDVLVWIRDSNKLLDEIDTKEHGILIGNAMRSP